MYHPGELYISSLPFPSHATRCIWFIGLLSFSLIEILAFSCLVGPFVQVHISSLAQPLPPSTCVYFISSKCDVTLNPSHCLCVSQIDSVSFSYFNNLVSCINSVCMGFDYLPFSFPLLGIGFRENSQGANLAMGQITHKKWNSSFLSFLGIILIVRIYRSSNDLWFSFIFHIHCRIHSSRISRLKLAPCFSPSCGAPSRSSPLLSFFFTPIYPLLASALVEWSWWVLLVLPHQMLSDGNPFPQPRALVEIWSSLSLFPFSSSPSPPPWPVYTTHSLTSSAWSIKVLYSSVDWEPVIFYPATSELLLALHPPYPSFNSNI